MTGRLICDLPYRDYAALPGIRSADLARAAVSPLHYRFPAPDKDTSSRVLLRAVHCLALEPEHYGEQFAVWAGGARRGKAWEAFEALHAGAGMSILTLAEEERARQVVAGILRHSEARALLTAEGQAEGTVTWTDPSTGLPCKARPDRLVGGRVVVDLKGYGTSEPRKASRMVAQRLAHVQAAHYAAGLVDGLGVPADAVQSRIVCYELAPPYDVCVLDLRDGLVAGAAMRRRLLDRLAECEAAGEWPGAAPGLSEETPDVYRWVGGASEDTESDGDEAAALESSNEFGPAWGKE